MLAGVEPKPSEEVELAQALGRVLAEPVDSRADLAAVGQLRHGWLCRPGGRRRRCQRRDDRSRLRVVGEVAAGAAPTVPLAAGTAVRILTGAPIPPGADAVVPVEDTDAPRGTAGGGALPQPLPSPSRRGRERTSARRAATSAPATGCLSLGTDCDRDLAAGRCRGTRSAGGLRPAACRRPGHRRRAGRRRHRVGPGADPRQQLAGSDCAGAQSRRGGALAWASRATTWTRSSQRLREAMAWADVVVASGGVSVGAHDVVKDAFARLGRARPVARRRPAGQAAGVRPGAAMAIGRCSCSACRATRSAASSPSSCSCGRCCAGWPAMPTSIGRDIVRARRSGDRCASAPGRRDVPARAAASRRRRMAGRLSPAARARTCSRRSPRPTAWRSFPRMSTDCRPARKST